MHEFSICRGLIEQAAGIARAHGDAKIAVIEIVVGDLAGVEVPLLERAFRASRAESPAHHANLVIERRPVSVRCQTCHAECEASVGKFFCSACGSRDVRFTGGDELLLKSVGLVPRGTPIGIAEPADVH